MELKEDFGEACVRLEAWWRNSCIDRAAIAVWAPRAGADSEPFPAAGSLEQQWLDVDYVVSRFEYGAERTFWGGEAIPELFVNLGPGCMAAFLTGRYVLGPDTVWFPEAVGGLGEVSELELNEGNDYWRTARELTEEAVRVGAWRFLTGVTDIGGVVDVLASLRRNANLLVDMVERPEEVKRARDHLVRVWGEVYERLYRITQKGQKGGASWLNGWSAGSHYPLQCDFSAMIGPKMFEEFVAPELRALSEVLGNRAYHLDGPDAIRHLDVLLEMPEIEAIQWVPGAGNPRPVEWMDLLKRIQRKGKALCVWAEPEDVERLVSELGPEGLCIHTSCRSEAEARDLIDEVERLSARKGAK